VEPPNTAKSAGSANSVEAARQWQKDNPELFVKTIRKLPGPDTWIPTVIQRYLLGIGVDDVHSTPAG